MGDSTVRWGEMVSMANSMPRPLPEGTIILAPSNPMQVWAMKMMLAMGLVRKASQMDDLEGRQYFRLAAPPKRQCLSSGKRKNQEPVPEPEGKRPAVEADLEEPEDQSEEGASGTLGKGDAAVVSELSKTPVAQLMDKIMAGVSRKKETDN